MQQVNRFFYGTWGGRLNNTGNNLGNLVLYLATLTGTFLADNLYLIVMVVFGAIHAYAAWRKLKRDDKEFEYKQKDRALLVAREEERIRLAEEIIYNNANKNKDTILIAELEKKRNRDHSNKRAELYLGNPGKRRVPLKSIISDNK